MKTFEALELEVLSGSKAQVGALLAQNCAPTIEAREIRTLNIKMT